MKKLELLEEREQASLLLFRPFSGSVNQKLDPFTKSEDIML
jgi:hypothetical protein